jgi:hypothetical protein
MHDTHLSKMQFLIFACAESIAKGYYYTGRFSYPQSVVFGHFLINMLAIILMMNNLTFNKLIKILFNQSKIFYFFYNLSSRFI